MTSKCSVMTLASVMISGLIAVPAAAELGETARSTVFKIGDGGEKYGYRIPAALVTQKGTLLVLCERRIGLGDHAQNDIVLRRSNDGGRTWGDVRVVADDGGDSLNDPLIVQRTDGRLLLRYTRFPKGIHANKSAHTEKAEPGYGGPKNTRLYLVYSDDDGQTWSERRDVTRQMRRQDAISIGSPGVGVELTRGEHRGRLLFPNYEVYDLDAGDRRTANSICYSDDGGETWKLGEMISENGLPGWGNEAQIVELSDGALLMSSRSHAGGEFRKVSISRDGGVTWAPFQFAKDLLTPACMSSVVRFAWPTDDKPGVLLHCLPNTKNGRANGTLLVSLDDGATWRRNRVIEPKGFAYSCLVTFPSGDVGCVYESGGYHTIEFVRFPLGDPEAATAATRSIGLDEAGAKS